MPARSHIAACFAVAAALLGSAPANADAARGCRPTVMAIHGGGFVDRMELATAARELERLGLRVNAIRYPLGDVRSAYRAAAAAARKLRARHGPVVALGESAGGTIASWLAARRRVDAAVAVGAPQDLSTWLAPLAGAGREIRLSTRDRQWRYSPARIYRRGHAAPLHLFQYRADPFVSPEQALAIERRGATVRMIDGPGHVGPVAGAPHWLDVGGRRVLRRQARALAKRCSSSARTRRPR